ncbi:class I SAM-dependent methyltransferase, partial [Candidatus Margulisiibacteriota bacterium]
MAKNISDYSDYNYQEDFWGSQRAYENLCEQKTIQKLLKKIPKKSNILLDVGCGFGRLFNSYKNFGNYFFLLDYAENLLLEAKNNTNTNTLLIQGNFYQIPLLDSSVDLAITIRTLHHITDIQAFFKEINRIVTDNGYFLFEVPNKRHLLNILRFIFGKSKQNPFSEKPLQINNVYFNYSLTY